MAAIVFDTLRYVNKLVAAGMSEKLAEAQAELMSEAFVLNVDALVTKDYLDARLSEQTLRLEARFAEQDVRIDARFAEVDVRFAAQEDCFSNHDIRFARIDGKLALLTWMLELVIVATVIPALHQLIS